MRLIDADKIGLTDFEIVMCNGDYKKALTMLSEKISNQPTAYDIDEVIKELKSEIKRWEDSGKEYGDKCDIAVARGLRNAVKIVKSNLRKYEEINNRKWLENIDAETLKAELLVFITDENIDIESINDFINKFVDFIQDDLSY